MKRDIIEIEILPDGTIKTTTDAVSMPNHQNAEGFMRQLATFAGGLVTRTRRIGASLHAALHAHASDGHTHEHGEEHHH